MSIVPISVTLVDHMGSDLSVVNAARVSMAKESHWEYKIATSDEGPYACQKVSQGLKRLRWPLFAGRVACASIRTPNKRLGKSRNALPKSSPHCSRLPGLR